jgi:predicted DNA-binding transcriptional regulator YafY
MRADRLISIIMLLKAYGRMTAQQMADELEVSERTIYRDIDALSISGVPIYADCGPGGGYDLLDSYRADLIGLTEQEIRALLMFSIPYPFKELGLNQELRGALLKLSAAISDHHQMNTSKSMTRIHLDPIPWTHSYEQVPYLEILNQAIIQNHMIEIKYQGAFNAEIRLIAAPLGMVAKTNIWYLICQQKEHIKVVRISTIIETKLLEEKFVYPEEFNLIDFWDEWCQVAEVVRPRYPVQLKISTELFKLLRYLYGDSFTVIEGNPGSDSSDTWVTIMLDYESFEEARNSILGFGSAAQIIEPQSLRMSVIDFAQQITKFYESGCFSS